MPARMRVEAPQSGGLRRRQLQTRHLVELAAYSIHKGEKFHGRFAEQAEGQLIVWVTWWFLNESGVFCAGAASSIGSIQTFPSLSECGPTGMSENRHSGASASATTSTSAPRPAI